LVVISAGLLASSIRANAQPENAERPPPPAERIDPAAIEARLTQRLEQIDEMRAHLAGAIEKLRAGVAPDEALGPMGVRLMQRRPWGDADDWGGPWGPPPGVAPGTGPRPERGPPAEPLQIEEVRAFIREHLPGLGQRLDSAGDADPTRTERMIRRMAPRIEEIMRQRATDPELARLRLQEMRTAMEIVDHSRTLRRLSTDQAAEGEVQKARRELRALLGRQFDLRQQLEARRIEKSRGELDEAARHLRERQGTREQVLDEHLERVLSRRGPDEDGEPPSDRGPRRRPRD
jgi:hypothetical protein